MSDKAAANINPEMLMSLSLDERNRFDQDGFLFLPALFSAAEIADLNRVAENLLAGKESADGMHRERERSGAIRQIYLAHRLNARFKDVAEDPRIVKPVQQILQADLYIWHSKINVKDAFEGTVWLWHQDYGYWVHDGVDPRLISVMVFLDKATINNGCLMVAAGSHKWGHLEHAADNVTTSYKQWCVDTEILKRRLTEEKIRHITGGPGDVLFFDCNLLHGSGHNMSPMRRKTFIIAYNDLGNRPRPVANPRPDWVVSRVFDPLPQG